MKYYFSILLLFIFLGTINAQDSAPPSLAATTTIKILALNKSLKGNVKIFVVGSDAIANELKKNVGNTIVSMVLSGVESGSDVPSDKYDIIFCASSGKASSVKSYAKKHKSLSITNIPDLVFSGITLGFGIDDDKKPLIFLNLSSSSEQGMDWNPAIMKVAQTVKN